MRRVIRREKTKAEDRLRPDQGLERLSAARASGQVCREGGGEPQATLSAGRVSHEDPFWWYGPVRVRMLRTVCPFRADGTRTQGKRG